MLKQAQSWVHEARYFHLIESLATSKITVYLRHLYVIEYAAQVLCDMEYYDGTTRHQIILLSNALGRSYNRSVWKLEVSHNTLSFVIPTNRYIIHCSDMYVPGGQSRRILSLSPGQVEHQSSRQHSGRTISKPHL